MYLMFIVVLCAAMPCFPADLMETYSFSSAKPDDAQTLLQLALTSHSNYQTQTIQRSAHISPELFTAGIIEKLLHNERIIGFYALDLTKDTPTLSHFFIKKGEQSKGYGRKLFARMVTLAAQRKIATITWSSDPHAQAFYIKMGARMVDTGCCAHNKKIVIPIFRYTTIEANQEKPLDQTHTSL